MLNRDPVDFAKLIPELPTWNNGNGISVESWIGCSGSFELAAGYSRFFWPDFVEHDGCVLFGGFSAASYDGFMKQREGDRPSGEAVMNHRHVFDYFSHAGASATTDQIIYLGRVLREIWETKLARQFPDRSFIVSFAEGPFDDISDFEVTFWQEAVGEAD